MSYQNYLEKEENLSNLQSLNKRKEKSTFFSEENTTPKQFYRKSLPNFQGNDLSNVKFSRKVWDRLTH